MDFMDEFLQTGAAIACFVSAYIVRGWRLGRGGSWLTGLLIFIGLYIMLPASFPAGLGLLLVVIASGVHFYFLFFAGQGGNNDGYVRGNFLHDHATFARRLSKVAHRFKLGGIPIPTQIETRSFLLAGAPGTGKSLALTAALDELRAIESSRAIIADAAGVLTARYYDPARGDVILNPFDLRTTEYSILAEIESIADIPAITKSLIPDAAGEGKVWSNYAQTFVECVIEYVYLTGGTSGDIYRLINAASTDELRTIAGDGPAASLLSPDNERMFASVRGTASTAVNALRYSSKTADATAFSIRRFIANDAGAGWIFINYKLEQRDALRGLISAQIDIAARAVLSMQPDLNRRIIFAVDELPLLGKINSIVELATNGRKFGSVIFAGLQTIAQLREIYGEMQAQTLLACFGSWLILQVPDAETAEYMSRYVGEREITRVITSTSSSSSSSGSSDSNSTSVQYSKDRLLLPSELQSLEARRGYLRIADEPGIVAVQIGITESIKAADAFVALPKPTPAPKPQPVPVPRQAQEQGQPVPVQARGGGDEFAND